MGAPLDVVSLWPNVLALPSDSGAPACVELLFFGFAQLLCGIILPAMAHVGGGLEP